MNLFIFGGCCLTFAALGGLIQIALAHQEGDRDKPRDGALIFVIGALLASIAFGLAAGA